MSNTRIFSATLVSFLVTLLTLLAAPLRADVLNVINADTSNSADWTATTVFLQNASLSATESFGSVLVEDSTMVFAGPGIAQTRRALEFNALSFDPSLKGAIVRIDYTVEHDRPSSTFNSHPFRVTLVQNGRFYSYFGAAEHRDNSPDSTFTNFSNSSTQATDWHEVTSSNTDVSGSNPDFSVSGSPITIALMPRHGGSLGGSQKFISQFRNFSVTFRTALLLIIDEDTINGGTNCGDIKVDSCISIKECAEGDCPGVEDDPINRDSDRLVSADTAKKPGDGGSCPDVIRIHQVAGTDGFPLIYAPGGQIEDEGIFSPALDAFADLPGGTPGYINCDPAQDEHFLDGLAAAPVRNIAALEGRTVCAVIHKSDISDLGDGEVNAMGDRNGRTAFEVIDVVSHGDGEEYLDVMKVRFLDSPDEVDAACECENLVNLDGEPYDCTAP